MTDVSLLASFKQSLPELRYLAVYDGPQTLRWGYDYTQEHFFSEAAAIHQPYFVKSDFVSEMVEYQDLLEYNLRCGSQVISCISGRKNINFKLLEFWLQQQSLAILALAPAIRLKPKASRSPKSKAVASKTPKGKTQIDSDKGLQKSGPPPLIALRSWTPPQQIENFTLKKLLRRDAVQSYQLQNNEQKFLARVFAPEAITLKTWKGIAKLCFDPMGQAIYEVFMQDGSLRLQRPWITGVSLQTLLERVGKISAYESLKLLYNIALQLQAYHRAGRIHANLSPGNILIDQQRQLILLDAGLSYLNASQRPVLEERHMLAGHPVFMAPEQVLKCEASPASDMFALGALLVFMISGKQSFATLKALDSQESRNRSLHAIAHLVFKDAEHAQILALVQNLLHESPAERPKTIDEVLQSLHQLLN